MKFIGIEKKSEGKYITRYDVTYETADEQKKVYEIISRNKEIDSYEKLNAKKADSIVMVVTDEKDEKILLNKEYRMAVGGWVYNFPAGLIDTGETVEESAIRELWEETGLKLYEITDKMFPSYGAIGFSNEINVCIVGKARGTIEKSTSVFEEIEAAWYTRKEVEELLQKEYFAARTQAYCYLWCREKGKVVDNEKNK